MRLNINGETRELHAEPGMPLLWALREHAGLTGTKYGCGIAQCGACTVHIDGMAVRSCSVLVEALEPTQKIVTIEGLGKEGLHPVQQAWLDLDVPQCGYCQSGMIMAAAALLAEHPNPDVDTIAGQITNICRCGTYNRVVAAIQQAARSASISNQG